VSVDIDRNVQGMYVTESVICYFCLSVEHENELVVVSGCFDDCVMQVGPCVRASDMWIQTIRG
jgi:hypothetical protein